ncbi:AsmA-like C-terminal region-containing protein [Labilibacter marinus]|uniref:AsmA-like C-terminal region-containing protein n=1 Tax=Labilibacter marinus TaxID=1477105 RepID=UPI00082F4FDA|nr:AsmA-like C-terminal region-containing protein [Labilibacter marinus]
MKKFFKILGGVVLFVLLLLIVIPMFFKGKIESLVKEEVNNQVVAKVDWDKFSLSLIKDFPNLSVGMSQLSVVGIDKFEDDTLVYLKDFVLSADLMSAISGQVSIERILIDQPIVNALVLADSTVNWEITRESEELEVEEEVEGESSAFGISLEQFEIKDAVITYVDKTMDLDAVIRNFNLNLSGDLSAATTNLQLESSIEDVSVTMESTKYLNKLKVNLEAGILADMTNMVFTFKENNLKLNDLNLGFNGSVGMLDEGYDLDLKLAAKETSFKSLLALVPAEFLTDLEGVETKGSLTLESSAKGVYKDEENLPAFTAILKVLDGQIKYPDLPKSINDINIDVAVNNPGGSPDNTITNIQTFHFKLGQNPFDASLLLKTPISNAQFNGNMVGVIDLGTLKDAIPLDSFDIKGVIDADMTLNGEMAMIEREDYEAVDVNGKLKVDGFEYASADLPLVSISEALMTFTPQRIALDKFISKVGKSDFELEGNIDNYLPYVFKDETIKGKLKHRSNLLNVNEFLVDSELEAAESIEDTAALELIAVPKNIDFVFTSYFGKIIYDKLEIDKTKGKITVRDGKVVLNGISMDLLDGKMKMAGQYNTQNVQKPFVDFIFDASNIDITKTANSFSIIDSLMPIAKSSKGKIAADFKYNSLLQQDMMPDIASITGGGNIKSKSIEVSNSKVLNNMADLLKKDKYRKMTAEDLDINFIMKDGKIIVEPFTAKVFGSKITVSGEQGFDQSLNYVVKTPVSRKDIAGAMSFLGGNFASSGDDVMVDVIVKGTAKDPKLSLDLTEAKKQVGKEVEKEAEKVVKDILKDDNIKNALEGIFGKKKKK